MQARFHRRSDSTEVAQFQPVQLVRQIALLDDRQTVRFVHVRGGLGEEPVRRDTDRTIDRRAEPEIEQALLDAARDGLGVFALALATDQVARHFVDGTRLAVRDAVLDGGHQQVVQLDVACRPGEHEPDFRAFLPCLANAGAGFHADGLGFVACGQATPTVGHDRHHADRSPAQARVVVLLDRGEIGVEIDEQAAQRHVTAPSGRQDHAARWRAQPACSMAVSATESRAAVICRATLCKPDYFPV